MLYICRRSSNINHMNRKHPNGYLPKIAYHMAQGNHAKVQYFADRQIETYGPLTSENMALIHKYLTQ